MLWGQHEILGGGESVDDMDKLRAMNQTRRKARRRAVRRRQLAAVASLVIIGAGAWATSGWWLHLGSSGSVGATTQPKVGTPSPTRPGKTTIHTTTTNQVANTTDRQNHTGTGSGGAQLPASVMLSVSPQNQNPQLPNGCEVTSLSMLFTAIGHPVSKMTLAKEMPYDKTPRVKNAQGEIVSWGNPNVGFVGSPYVWADGYGIYHGPIVKLINMVLPGEGVDLTKKPFNDLLSYVAQGIPVEAWVTVNLAPTDKFWETWQTPEGPITVTQQEHAVLIVGYDASHIYINNPFNGEKDEAVSKKNFLGAWQQLGEQAVTIAVHN